MSSTPKNCIISFANRNGNYMQGLARLVDSLRDTFDGEVMAWVGENSLGCEPHLTNPYAFKIKAFNNAILLGFDNILWLDSSCFAIKPVQPVFDHINEYGYIMQEAGHYAGNWTNDEGLRYFGITREQAMQMPMYGNAGFLGINRKSILAREFFLSWKDACDNGIFKGSWENHRHDMSCGSIIANQLGMQYESAHKWLQYANPKQKAMNESIIFKASGL